MRTRSLALLLLLIVLAGCATNPVTGRRQISLMTEQGEIELGRGSDVQIIAQYGLVDDPALASYVDGIGQRMAQRSHRPDLQFHFRVLDDPVVNAFALPGGYTYVTRGILAHLNSEAALAGVIGHEIGHVTAMHGVQRMTNAQLLGLGLAVGGAMSETFAQYAGLAGTAGQLLLLKYGRDDERQSDELGVQYATTVGYNTHDMAEFFKTLDRLAPADGRVPSWMSTHPDPGERWNTVHALTDTRQAGQAGPFVLDREAYLQKIAGLSFGEDPREGFFSENYFHHPQMKFRFPIPTGWQGQNTKAQVVMVHPEQKAVWYLQVADGSTPQEAVTKWVSQEGLTLLGRSSFAESGRQFEKAEVAATSQSGTQVATSYFFQWDSIVFVAHGLAAEADYKKYSSTFHGVIRGFLPETDPEVLNVKPIVVKLIASKGGSFAQNVRDYPVPEGAAIDGTIGLAILNGVEPTTSIPAGRLLKVLVRDGS